MQRIVCQQCGASVPWDGTSRIATCPYCGVQYNMHPQTGERPEADGIGRDEVAILPIRTGSHAGKAYARSFIPKGWTAEAANPELSCSMLSPLTMRVRYTADDGRATISRTGVVGYEHIENTRGNVARQWQLDASTGMHQASYHDAPALCDLTVSGSGAAAQLLSHEEDQDRLIADWVERLHRSTEQNNVAGCDVSYCRRTYRVTRADGSVRLHAVEALSDIVGIPPSPAELQMFQQAQALLARTNPLAVLGGFLGQGVGGLFGQAAGGLLGQGASGIQPPQTRYLWEIVLLIDVEAEPAAFDEAREIAATIRASYQESPEFEQTKARMHSELMQVKMQLEQQSAQAINSSMQQMARDNAAHWDRMNDITRDANEHISGVMHDMIASNAATNDRMANLRSETIREVNTYYGSDGVVEASTSWDHLYQSTQDPDRYIATEGFELRPGIDYEELRRTQGDY